LFVVWEDHRDGNYEIYFKRSTNNGSTWEADTRLTNGQNYSVLASVVNSGLNVYTVWFDRRDGNDEIYFKQSSDNGISWGSEIRLTNDIAFSGVPLLSVCDSSLHLVWRDDRDGNNEIYYKRSMDNGLTWSADYRITNNTGFSDQPSIVVSDSIIHVAWYDDYIGNYEIYYKRSIDNGFTWETEIRLTNNSFISFFPSLAVAGSAVYVVWSDERDGNSEIYFKKNPTGNLISSTSVQNSSNGELIPRVYILEQNYPNPFNPSTVIEFSLPEDVSNVKLSIYNMLGEKVAELVNTSLTAGKYSYTWNAQNIATGMYIYELRTEKFVSVEKMMLLK
jgi:hypothetical protein